MTKAICHVCKTNVLERTPGYGVGWANVNESGVFAWFTDMDRAIEYWHMLTELKDIEPIKVWDLCQGKVIHT